MRLISIAWCCFLGVIGVMLWTNDCASFLLPQNSRYPPHKFQTKMNVHHEVLAAAVDIEQRLRTGLPVNADRVAHVVMVVHRWFRDFSFGIPDYDHRAYYAKSLMVLAQHPASKEYVTRTTDLSCYAVLAINTVHQRHYPLSSEDVVCIENLCIAVIGMMAASTKIKIDIVRECNAAAVFGLLAGVSETCRIGLACLHCLCVRAPGFIRVVCAQLPNIRAILAHGLHSADEFHVIHAVGLLARLLERSESRVFVLTTELAGRVVELALTRTSELVVFSCSICIAAIVSEPSFKSQLGELNVLAAMRKLLASDSSLTPAIKSFDSFYEDGDCIMADEDVDRMLQVVSSGGTYHNARLAAQVLSTRVFNAQGHALTRSFPAIMDLICVIDDPTVVSTLASVIVNTPALRAADAFNNIARLMASGACEIEDSRKLIRFAYLLTASPEVVTWVKANPLIGLNGLLAMVTPRNDPVVAIFAFGCCARLAGCGPVDKASLLDRASSVDMGEADELIAIFGEGLNRLVTGK